jgi:malate synthase
MPNPQPSHAGPNAGTGIAVTGGLDARRTEILTPAALALVADLHRRFNPRRLELLARRRQRARLLRAGELPDFEPATADIRAGDWRVGPVPDDLQDRRVEITGPVDRKMIINALNAPVRTFMADFEDSCAPSWPNIIEGQINLRDAVRRTIEYRQPDGSRTYRLNARTAVLIVRPRGWHLPEAHVLVDGAPVSGSIFDFALFLFHNAGELRARGSGPYFYLPKLESHLEARLWNDVIVAAQDALGIPRGTVKVTVLIETILAAFEMDEILYELRDHIVGLNCGRWDYIFSFIKKLGYRGDSILPDRSTVTMDRHFLKSYVELLIRTCHRRGAHAMGGMAAQIPIKDDAAANERAMAKVREDKLREARAGHDGTWIAHPGLAPIALEAFDELMPGANQVNRLREDVAVSAADLLKVPEGPKTEQGLRHNIRVGVQYLESWLGGNGCVPLYHLMEDAATAEISRAQLWQWLHHRISLEGGPRLTRDVFQRIYREECEQIRTEVGESRYNSGKFALAESLFGDMVQRDELDEFLTIPAYEYLKGE